ncbi:Aminoglycoside phosphotransferase [Penicillium atrosanguineum]|nr:Aminoglycoside phosphotransferase [Penicillium atrosanguineum]
MDFDDLAFERSARIFQVWLQNLLENSPETLARTLASEHYPDSTPVTASRLPNGAFNICYRVLFEDGCGVVVRFVGLGRVIARNEKVEDEVAIMQYLAQHTAMPIPNVLGSGNCPVGPYIVMDFVEGKPLSECLTDESKSTVTLRSDISISVLREYYSGMAKVLLELSKPEFSHIGAVRQGESGEWTVQKRPLTFNMNRLAQFSNIPLKVFKRGRFSNAADYFEELAQHQFYHLELQRNDAVTDEADCRKEISKEHCKGPFRLYCDDLRPGNVLVDASSLAVTGVVDWEFAYAAPVEFTLAAPWWLLLESPEDWEPELDQFLLRFMPRLRTFLEILRKCEDKNIQDGTLSESQRLSNAMEKSLETGLFWICLALRHSSMFDEIYWTFLDSRFYGPFTTIEDRVGLLSAEERDNIHSFVESKMRQASERTLISHYDLNELVNL